MGRWCRALIFLSECFFGSGLGYKASTRRPALKKWLASGLQVGVFSFSLACSKINQKTVSV